MDRLTLFHRTTNAAANSIIANGFRDGEGSFLTRSIHQGVWLSNLPVDANEGAQGETLLRVDLLCDEEAIAEFEWVEELKTCREWLVPAKLVNELARVSIVDEDDALEH